MAQNQLFLASRSLQRTTIARDPAGTGMSTDSTRLITSTPAFASAVLGP